MNYTAEYPSPLGKLILCGDGEALTGLWIEGQKYFGGGVTGEMVPGTEVPALKRAKEWLDRYFAGEDPERSMAPLSLSPAGSEFRQAVWKLLRGIPRGQVTTYGALARTLARQTGKKVSPQAVGGAVGHNPISIIIPCHRVVGTDGGLTGYAGGLEKKLWLLRREGVKIGNSPDAVFSGTFFTVPPSVGSRGKDKSGNH